MDVGNWIPTLCKNTKQCGLLSSPALKLSFYKEPNPIIIALTRSWWWYPYDLPLGLIPHHEFIGDEFLSSTWILWIRSNQDTCHTWFSKALTQVLVPEEERKSRAHLSPVTPCPGTISNLELGNSSLSWVLNKSMTLFNSMSHRFPSIILELLLSILITDFCYQIN